VNRLTLLGIMMNGILKILKYKIKVYVMIIV